MRMKILDAIHNWMLSRRQTKEMQNPSEFKNYISNELIDKIAQPQNNKQ
jgi:hypothetical protein